MLKKLRRKFILIAALSFALALVLILGVVNAVNYANVLRSTELRLEQVVRRDISDRVTRSPWDDFFFPERRSRYFEEEDPENERWFTVTVFADGSASAENTLRADAPDAEAAEALALRLYGANDAQGLISGWRYGAVRVGSDIVYYFLDCTRETDAFRSFFTASCLAAAAGLLLVTLLVVIFSKLAIRPVAESYEKQKRFITDASHELKTPLAVISAANEVTEMESGETEWTRSISKQVARLTSLTEKLVMLSRMDEENYKPNVARFDLSAAARETAQSFEAVAQHRQKTYTAEIEDGVFYEGDESAIRQLLSLLIDNAMKYSNENGSVAVRLKRAGRSVHLQVENTVDDMEKGDKSEFFERFYRADASRNSATGGHGIGLSVAKAIVTAHKGKISAVCPDGKSIVFTAVL